jgi:hypothetical protein
VIRRIKRSALLRGVVIMTLMKLVAVNSNLIMRWK